MIDTIGKTILIEAIKELIKEIFQILKNENLSPEKRKLVIEALIAIQKASIKTRNFIKNEGYKTNEDLSELWQTALQKTLNAEIKELPDFLFHKAEFWGSPQDWLKKDASMELVPKLKYIDEQCRQLLIKMKK